MLTTTITPSCSIDRSAFWTGQPNTERWVIPEDMRCCSLQVECPIRSQPVNPYASRITDGGLGVLHALGQARDQKESRPSLFDRYIEGWAEADVGKILDGTAPSYRFTDPFVGSFSGRSLYEYFDLLQDRFSRGGRSAASILFFPVRSNGASVASQGTSILARGPTAWAHGCRRDRNREAGCDFRTRHI